MAVSALGCASRKEFCARFRAVNPATQCDLERLNKWMQGRSLPRVSSVYADFAAVIGTSRPGNWVAECAIEAFAAELAACTGAELAALTADQPASRGKASAGGLFGGIATLAGVYAAYSPSWSPHFRGQLIRGSLRLAEGRKGRLIATYAERLLGSTVRLTGEAQIAGHSMSFSVRQRDDGMPLFISLHVPGPPASVMCGVMSGAAFVAHEALPSASRIVIIRVPETPQLDASNRYFHPSPGAIVADLADLGFNIPDPGRLDAVAREFIGTTPNQVTSQEQAAFASMLDREFLSVAS